TSITVPSQITKIGSSAFAKCTGLTEIYFNASSTTAPAGYYAPFGYAGDDGDGVRVYIGKSVSEIPANLFLGCSKIISVEFEAGSMCTSIGMSAFYNCTGLVSIDIPDSVTFIGSLGFSGCSELTSVNLGNGITTIQSAAFRDCAKLESVTVGSELKEIYSEVFSGCSSLKSIMFRGTAEQWASVTKGTSWDSGTGNYTVIYDSDID
ncbi:MAG: leucine-rich repeat domain-containing protein, partial [Clostridia bacterium]|nr:leucine-rich repeat domain-containing protein [Clostridia bacterium]